MSTEHDEAFARNL
jgi:hypothetical protein